MDSKYLVFSPSRNIDLLPCGDSLYLYLYLALESCRHTYLLLIADSQM